MEDACGGYCHGPHVRERALDAAVFHRRVFGMLATNIWFWVGFIAFVLAMLAVDLGVFNRTPHVVGAREALTWTAVWVVLSLLFAAGLASLFGRPSALTFLPASVIPSS